MALKVPPSVVDSMRFSAPNMDAIEDTVLDKMAHKHIRVVVVGNVDAAKSTLIGTLVFNTLDDGRGLARSKIIKHKHELVTGRTASITSHLLGLETSSGAVKTVIGGYQKTVLQSDRIVSLMDVAGHEKYMKTTVGGVARGMADYALVLVNASQPPTTMTLQHLKLCISMNIPVVILLTKMDRCPDQIFKETKQEIGRILKSSELGLHPFMIKVEEDVDMVQDKMASLTPILPVSCITGQGLDLLKGLLTKLPQRRKHAKKQLDKPFEFLIEEIFQVPGVGTVVSGFVSRGMWKKGKPIFIGPLKDGTVMKVVPKSAHVAKTSVGKVCAGHQACFALPKLPRIRRMLLGKGMVAMKRSFEPSKKFIADIYLTKGTTVTVEAGKFHATLNILHAKQSAKVVNIQVGNTKQNIIRQGDSARVTFEFVKKPSFVRPGMRFILRSGHVIGYGVVKAPC